MWRETAQERLKRYKSILKASESLYNAALSSYEKEVDAKETEDVQINAVYFVLAPALLSFVVWILKKALEGGKKRIYFLARDAFFMYEAADKICSELSLPIECRYLSCSRYSLRIPMYSFDTEEALDFICRGGIDITPDKILSRAALSPEEKKEVYKELDKGGLALKEDEPVAYSSLEEIKKALGKCDVFIKYMNEHSKKAFPALKGYLLQEGLSDGVPFALADSGWTGSMQKLLGKALALADGKKEEKTDISGFYWGLYELPEGADPKKYHCYYFSPVYNMREKIFFSNCLFEAVFSAPHGMTLGYEEENGVCVPVYDSISKEQLLFMEKNRKRFAGYTESLLEGLRSAESGKEGLDGLYDEAGKKVIYKLLKTFMARPVAAEASAFGCLHFSDDVVDARQQQLAAHLSDAELKSNHAFSKILSMLGLKKGSLKESAWYEGSAVRNARHVKKHLRAYGRYKRLLYIRKKLLWRKIYGKEFR